MTVVHTEYGYLETDYNVYPYNTAFVFGASGIQVRAVINATDASGVQAKRQILDYPRATGLQTRGIIDAIVAMGVESRLAIRDDLASGVQTQRRIVDYLDPNAVETRRKIVDFEDPQGVETRRRIIDFETPLGLQTRRIIVDFLRAVGAEARRKIVDFPNASGIEAVATKLTHLTIQNQIADPFQVGLMHAILGIQTKRHIVDRKSAHGLQTRLVIEADDQYGLQTRLVIKDFLNAVGLQAQQVLTLPSGLQAFAQIYNTNNLRILSEFPSRGTTGNNWTASSTATGDYAASNLNSDLTEQIWRSDDNDTSSIQLICDTQLPQGVFIDTFAMLNHNLTSSATVVLQGANVSNFSTVGVSINLSVTPDNIYYIAPEAPTSGWRYWRISIDDPFNGDNFVSVGTIVFGRANIFQGECHTDEIQFSFKDFADTVATEGFTNVSNSRALKKVLNLDFRYLRFSLANFRILRSINTTYRTTHKLLWIPTPDPIDQTTTGRFAVFGKLAALPQETHNYKGPNADYVSLSVEVDESR